MKLQDLLTDIFKITDPNDYGFKLLQGDILSAILPRIKECEEFSDVTEIRQLRFPITVDSNDKTWEVTTMKLTENDISANGGYEPNFKFSGILYLYSIGLTPEMFDSKDLHKIVKDGAAITPSLYNPITFIPYKQIVLEFCPEQAQDSGAIKLKKLHDNDPIKEIVNDAAKDIKEIVNDAAKDINEILNEDKYGMGNDYNDGSKDVNYSAEDIVRNELHNKLNMVLDNPQEYQIKGKRGILVRALFNCNEDLILPLYESKIQTPGCVAYYVVKGNPNKEKEGNNWNTMTVELRSKIIPIQLRDKFQEKFSKLQIIDITEEMINNFIIENIENEND